MAAGNVETAYISDEETSESEEESSSECSDWNENAIEQYLRKRLACVFEDCNVQQPDSANVIDIFTKAIEIRRKEIAAFTEMICKCHNVDVCIVMDATTNMEKYIQGMANSIEKVASNFIPSDNQHPRVLSKLRIACIAYRDHNYQKHIETFEFCEDVKQLKAFLSQLTTGNEYGGADPPEDVLGGLWRAKYLSWSPNAGVKLMFHVGDRPPHGKQFHQGSMFDNFPNGHPDDQPVENIFKWLKDENINYAFGKISDSTDKMIEIFRELAATEILEFNVKNSKSIGFAIRDSIIMTVDDAIWMAKNQFPGLMTELGKNEIDLDCPEWEDVGKQIVWIKAYEMFEDIEDIIKEKPLQRIISKQNFIQIAPNPFAEGKERFAFYARNVTTKKGVTKTPEKIVCKEFKLIGNSENIGMRYYLANQLQAIFHFLVSKFSNLVNCSDPTLTLKVLHVQTFKFDDNKRLMTSEREYFDGSKFIRFQSDIGCTALQEKAKKFGIDPNYVDLVLALSHWTHYISSGYLMIADCKGIVVRQKGHTRVILTDPTIHCQDPTRFGRLNLAEAGMQMFFNTHECKHHCKHLKLVPNVFKTY